MKKLIILPVFLIFFLSGKGQYLLPGQYLVKVLDTAISSNDSLTVNNVNASFGANGVIFSRDTLYHLIYYTVSGFPHDTIYDTVYDYGNSFEHFKVLKGSNISSIFAGDIWMGGIDANGKLHVSAETYGTIGTTRYTDFWPGPIDSITHNTDSITSARWNKVWKVTKDDIYAFLHPTCPLSVSCIPFSILVWPAKGNPYAEDANGKPLTIDQDEAPFVDVDSDGIYNPTIGDYPDIKGDEMLWWVFNDLAQHTETNGLPIALEIQGSAYAYYCQDDSILDNTIFVRNKLIYKGNSALHNSYVGSWLSFDIGCGNNYVGCDSTTSTYYGYNATGIDSGCANGFGNALPLQMITMLQTPKDSTGKELGMTDFKDYNNDFTVQGNPTSDTDYYYYLEGLWKDGSPQTLENDCATYGGGIPTHFMFPSDPTGPASPASFSECSCGRLAGDRRSLASTGPFTFNPGDIQVLEQAFIFHRFAPNEIQGCQTPFQAADVQHIKDLYNNNFTTACTNSCTGDSYVWPGDANADGIANNFDLLDIGLGYNSTGPARVNPSISWVGQCATQWNDTFPGGINFDHADCNGDSIINANDTVAILQNYGLTHNKTADNQGTPGAPLIYPASPYDSVGVSTAVYIPINLGTAAIPAQNVMAIAFTISYNPNLVTPNTAYFQATNSWLGLPNTNLVYIQKPMQAGLLDVGITRIDHAMLNGSGTIGTFGFVTIDNLSGKVWLNDTLIMNISNVRMIMNDGTILPYNTQSDSLIISQYTYAAGISSISHQPLDVYLFPNPTTGIVNYTVTGLTDKATYSIDDITGRILFSGETAFAKELPADN